MTGSLFESLVKAVDRAPERLDHVATLIEDLGQDTDGQPLLPDGFLEIWEPIWAARKAIRR